jgi:hypothetical protein
MKQNYSRYLHRVYPCEGDRPKVNLLSVLKDKIGWKWSAASLTTVLRAVGLFVEEVTRQETVFCRKFTYR